MADHAHDHDHANCDHDHSHDHDAFQVTAVVEDLGPCKKLLKVEVPPETVKREISHRLEHLRRGVTLKGFRKGKAPRNRIEQLYGDAVREDARDHLLREGYVKALEDQLGADKVLGEGTIENVAFSAEEGLKFEVTLHTRPEFDLGDYKGVEVKVPPLRVEEKDIDAAIDRMRRMRGEMRPVEGPDAVVEPDDLLSVDVQVWLADEYERFSQAQEQQQQTELKPLKEHFGLQIQLPSTTLGDYEVEDLADSLVGLKVGEWGEAETDLPEDFDVVEGRNEPAVLRIRVEAIKRLALAELTEEWAKELGHASLADLRREVREELQQRLELGRRHEIELKVLGALLERVGPFALPTDLVDKEVENAERRKYVELRIQGRGDEEAKNAVEEERENIRREVERTLRFFFILDVVARKENITVSERDVDARIARLAAARGQNPAKVREELEKHDVIGQVRHDLMEEKTRAFLREHARIIEED